MQRKTAIETSIRDVGTVRKLHQTTVQVMIIPIRVHGIGRACGRDSSDFTTEVESLKETAHDRRHCFAERKCGKCAIFQSIIDNSPPCC